MKILFVLLVVFTASSCFAETWKDEELRKERELQLKSQQSVPQKSTAPPNSVAAANELAACLLKCRREYEECTNRAKTKSGGDICYEFLARCEPVCTGNR